MESTEELASLSARLRDIAADAATGVGPGLRAAFRTGISAGHKTNAHDLVTEHDRASEEAIVRHLLACEPDSRVLGEEGGHRGHGRIEWIVDPIDGTSNFAHGVAFFCVSIAAALEGELLAGVVYDPIAGLLFTADLTGAYLNGAPLHPQAEAEEARACLMTDYPSAEALALDGPAGLEAFGELVGTYATVRRKVSAALALAHVAAGWTDATLGLDTTRGTSPRVRCWCARPAAATCRSGTTTNPGPRTRPPASSRLGRAGTARRRWPSSSASSPPGGPPVTAAERGSGYSGSVTGLNRRGLRPGPCPCPSAWRR